MGFYKITIRMNDGKIFEGIKELMAGNVYSAHYEAWQLATKALCDQDICTINAKPVEKSSPELIEYLEKQALKGIERNPE